MNSEQHISIYILCGGTNKRMGTEKGLILFNGKTFIEWIIEAVKPFSDSISLITNNKDYEPLGYPMIPDIYPDKGPVGGIYTALVNSTNDLNIVLSSDIPNINSKVLKKYLLERIHELKDVMFLADVKKAYPLIGVYSKHLTPQFEKALQNDQLKLMELLKEFDVKTIQVDTEDYNALKNINTKQELMQLKKSTK